MAEITVLLAIFLVGCLGAMISKVLEYKTIMESAKNRKAINENINELKKEIGNAKNQISTLKGYEHEMNIKYVDAVTDTSTKEDEKECKDILLGYKNEITQLNKTIKAHQVRRAELELKLSGTGERYISLWKWLAILSVIVGGGFAVFISLITFGFEVKLDEPGNLLNFFIYGAFWDQIFHRVFAEKSEDLVKGVTDQVSQKIPST